jgi:two-component system cell cycle sensor histidine kinase/response regulator CckA
MGKKEKCWELLNCGKEGCPAFGMIEPPCWLTTGTLCRDETQGEWFDKIDLCLECQYFQRNLDSASLPPTLALFKQQLVEYRRMVDERDLRFESSNRAVARGLEEVFEALRMISEGDPEVRISEDSEIEVLAKLKRMVNRTAENLGEIVDLSHEFAIGLAEHFDVLHRVSQGDLAARVHGSSPLELLGLLERVTNDTIAGIAREIAERRHAEQALKTEKERLAVTLRSIGDAVVATDLDGRILLMNHIAEQLTGWSAADAFGQPSDRVFRFIDEKEGTGYLDPIATVMKTGRALELAGDKRLEARDKTRRFISASGAPIIDEKRNIIGVVLVVRDATGTRKMEAEMAKLDKLSSLGTLAGGIAHDFNNILTAILGNLSLARLYIPPDSSAHRRLEEAEKACQRAQKLSTKLVTFAKGGAPIKRVTTLLPLVQEATTLALCGSKSTCRLSFAPGLHLVEIDEGQISQVVHNLIVNADQAMAEGGVIEVAAKNVVLDDNNLLGLAPGPYVVLSVGDSGPGIAPDCLKDIFLPYFATKSKSNALGLAACHSIIRSHGGSITVESEMGKGSTFFIYLPAAKEKPSAGAPAGDRPGPGHRRILIMDDEEMIREVMSAMLEGMAYEVACVGDGAAAIDIYKQAMAEGSPFSAVIFDLTVPGGMGGKETLDRLLVLDPGVKAIVSSGYSDDPIMADFQKYGFKGVITKPYKMAELSRVLERVLGGSKTE